MGFRFSKRIKLMPGVRLNVGLRGMSVSAGSRGASVTMGPKGVYGNVGLPGTGLSYRTRLDKPHGHRSAGSRDVAPIRENGPRPPERIQLSFSGAELEYRDEFGSPLAPAAVDVSRYVFRDQIKAALETRAADLNASFDTLRGFHLGTPAPAKASALPMLNGAQFSVPKPTSSQDPNDPRDFPTRLSDWRIAQAAHAAESSDVDLEGIAEPVLARLGSIEWPRETNIAVDVDPSGRTLILAVDLPEAEHMPNVEYVVVAKTLSLKEKPLSARTLSKLYAAHIQALLFRIVGESFAASGAVHTVKVGGYCQRISPSTACEEDVWVAEVSVDRPRWAEIDFNNLNALDTLQALTRFEPRMDVTASGVFRPIKVSRDFTT